MLAGIRDILLITTPRDRQGFYHLLGDGSQFGIRLTYCEQPSPDGLAQAFLLGREFIGDRRVALVLGDNIFYGDHLEQTLATAVKQETGATVFAQEVHDPERYGVVEFDNDGVAISIEEKPSCPKSPYAVTGLYFYDNSVVEIAADLQPSNRGELEITDVNLAYLRQGLLNVQEFGPGFAWLDTGTPQSLLAATKFVSEKEQQHDLLVGSPDEVAFLKQYISAEQLKELGERYGKSSYGRYLIRVAENRAPSPAPIAFPTSTMPAAGNVTI